MDGAGLFEIKTEVVNSLAKYKYEDSLKVAEQFIKAGKRLSDAWAKSDEATSKTDINRRASGTIIRILISAFNDVMRLSLDGEAEMTNIDQKRQIAGLADRIGAEQAAEKIEECFESLRWIESSVNEKLLFERLLLKLASCDRMKV
jgi:hypothetical protein